MLLPWSYLGEWAQHEIALGHERVGDGQFWSGEHEIVVEKDVDGSFRATWMRSGLFEILSDPLGLLDPAQTEWKDNLAMQREAHPTWFRQKS